MESTETKQRKRIEFHTVIFILIEAAILAGVFAAVMGWWG